MQSLLVAELYIQLITVVVLFIWKTNTYFHFIHLTLVHCSTNNISIFLNTNLKINFLPISIVQFGLVLSAQ